MPCPSAYSVCCLSVLVQYWLFPVLMASHFTGRQRHRWPGHLLVMVCDRRDCCVVSVSLSVSFYSAAIFLVHFLLLSFLCNSVSTPLCCFISWRVNRRRRMCDIFIASHVENVEPTVRVIVRSRKSRE